MVKGRKHRRRAFKLFRAALLALLFLVIASQAAYAQGNRIESIDVDVTLDENGTGYFTEVWKVDFRDKTEIFRPMGDLGGARLYNYRVSQDGEPMTEKRPWDVDASFSRKAGKYGINQTGTGFELCFGLGKYGPTTFVVNYEVEGLVMQYDDYQAIYWKFINDNMNPAPESATVTVRADDPFHYESERIWGFGFRGQLDIPEEGGPIVMTTDAPFTSDSQLILLARFPEGKFATQNRHEGPFEQLIDLAFKGSSYDKNDYNPHATYEDIRMMDHKEDRPKSIWEEILKFLMYVGGGCAIGALAIYTLLIGRRKRKLENEMYPSLEVLSKAQQGEYVRDIPTDSPFELYDIFEKLQVKNLEANYLTVGILELISSGHLIPESVERGLVFKRDETALRINESKPLGNIHLSRLLKMIIASAGSDMLLTQKEFSRYAAKNMSTYAEYAEKIKNTSRDYLRKNGFYAASFPTGKGIEGSALRSLSSQYQYALSEKGANERENLVRFYNYLKDFSLLNERGSREVHLWDLLMIYAAAFGITEELEKEFEKIYPNYQEESYYAPGTVYWASTFGQAVNKSYVNAVRASESSSSGGGGSSSFGGGGGSFGGGSGGGGR